jgi:class 3 adenylate cyclase
VVFTDVAGFADPTRTDQDRKVIRQVMFRILRHSFDGASICWDECHQEDRGDGALIVVPPHIPTRLVVHPLLASLADELHRHNVGATDATRFQLRIALHVGPVESDEAGVNGEAIIQAARLLEAPAFKHQLTQTKSCMGMIASNFVYDSVIKHRPGHVDPASYQKIRGRVKGFTFTAWITLVQIPQ